MYIFYCSILKRHGEDRNADRGTDEQKDIDREKETSKKENAPVIRLAQSTIFGTSIF